MPFPAEASLRFARATKALSAVRLLGLVHTPPSGDDAGLFADVARVENPLSASALAEAVSSLVNRYGPVHRLVGILEHLQVQLAQIREALGIEGLDVATANRFRDKAKMKEVLREAGLPCARHRLIGSTSDAHAFVGEVGLPIVLKPPAGAGCKATWRITRPDQLEDALSAVRPRPQDPTLAEEFVVGSEHSLETVTVSGEVRMTSTTDYFPTPLEVVENPWIQWVVVAPREQDGPELGPVHALGRNAVQALGLRAGMTHMEWFRREDGSLAIGEIAARPPGAHIARLTGLAHDTSMYRAWARAMVDDAFDGPWPRAYSAGCAYLRGMGRGRVIGVDGIQKIHGELGGLVVEAKVPAIGSAKNDSYEGDGYALVRHPDTGVVRDALRRIIETVRVYYA